MREACSLEGALVLGHGTSHGSQVVRARAQQLPVCGANAMGSQQCRPGCSGTLGARRCGGWRPSSGIAAAQPRGLQSHSAQPSAPDMVWVLLPKDGHGRERVGRHLGEERPGGTALGVGWCWRCGSAVLTAQHAQQAAQRAIAAELLAQRRQQAPAVDEQRGKLGGLAQRVPAGAGGVGSGARGTGELV